MNYAPDFYFYLVGNGAIWEKGTYIACLDVPTCDIGPRFLHNPSLLLPGRNSIVQILSLFNVIRVVEEIAPGALRREFQHVPSCVPT